jgi:hypothetical protein
MADVTIRHDHENGTRIEGSSKGDGVWDILRDRGWTYRDWAGIHIRGSRDTFTYPADLERHAQTLRDAGHVVTVTIDNTWRPAAVRWAEREERAENRADRYTDRAGRAATRSTTAYEGVRHIADGIPFGQPILVGHHSEGRARRDVARMDAGMRRSIAEADYASHLADRAEGARRNEAAKHNPRAIMRKIEELETGIRRGQRALDGLERRFRDGNGQVVGVERHEPVTGDSASIAQLRIARDIEEVAYLRGLLAEHADAGTFTAWSAATIAKGDIVEVAGLGWYRVTRINQKSVSLDGDSWPRTAKWGDIHGRRRDGMQIDTPTGQPWPAEQADKVERWRRLHERAVRHCGSRSLDDPEYRKVTNVKYAMRLVHGLPITASDAEVRAVDTSGLTVAEHRDLACRYLAVWRRLQAGERVPDVAASLAGQAAPGTAAWRVPADREPVDRRVVATVFDRVDMAGRILAVGDLVVGYWDRWPGQMLVRQFCGPVAAVGDVRNRREPLRRLRTRRPLVAWRLMATCDGGLSDRLAPPLTAVGRATDIDPPRGYARIYHQKISHGETIVTVVGGGTT